MTPNSPPQTPDHQPPVEAPPVVAPRRWQGRLLTICFGVFAFEVGLFLVVFPWQDSWTFNYFQASPGIADLWDEPSFKGLITGLGFVNIYISLLQVFRLFRRKSSN